MQQNSSTGSTSSNYVENVQELNYNMFTLWTENNKQLKRAVSNTDESEVTGKCLERIKGIKQEVEFKTVLTDPGQCLKVNEFLLEVSWHNIFFNLIK